MLHAIFDSEVWGKAVDDFKRAYAKADGAEKERLKTWLLNEAVKYKKQDEAARIIAEEDKKRAA